MTFTTYSGALGALPAAVVFGSTDKSPQKREQSNGLPGEIRRQNQEPCDRVSCANLAAQSAEEVSKSVPTVGSKYLITDKIDRYRQDYQANKEQAKEQA